MVDWEMMQVLGGLDCVLCKSDMFFLVNSFDVDEPTFCQTIVLCLSH